MTNLESNDPAGQQFGPHVGVSPEQAAAIVAQARAELNSPAAEALWREAYRQAMEDGHSADDILALIDEFEKNDAQQNHKE